MAVTTHDAGAAPDLSADPRPRWPAGPIDPTAIDLDYDPPADELTLYFGGKPVPAFGDPLDAPGTGVALLVGMNEDETSTGEVVGIQVMPLLVGAVKAHPGWATLAWGALAGYGDDETLREAVAAFLVDVERLFARSVMSSES